MVDRPVRPRVRRARGRGRVCGRARRRLLRRYVGHQGRGVAFQPWGGRQPTPGWWAARRVVLGPTPERQPLVCSWRLEGNLAVTHKFSTSTLCVSSLLSLCDTLQRSRARASERLRRACRFVLPSDSFALPRTRKRARTAPTTHAASSAQEPTLQKPN